MNKPYFPNLDGLRFLAFFVVFCAHSFYSKDPMIASSRLYQTFRHYGHLGIFGVNFFFVLSGFLITYLLIAEKEERSIISLKNFYTRRILRIWPLYYAVVFIGFFIVPAVQHLLGNADYAEKAPLLPYLMFYNNFLIDAPIQTAILGILWSIAVEEQFYFVWPVVMLYLGRKRQILFFLMIIMVSMTLRMTIVGWGYGHTLSCMSDLAVGSFIAHQSYYNAKWLQIFQKMNRSVIIAIYALGGTIFLCRQYLIVNQVYYLNERLIYSIFFAFVILEQNLSSNSFFKMRKRKTITNLGKISYGLYMLHFIVIYIVAKIFEILDFISPIRTFLIEPAIVFLGAVFIAKLSYKYFEKPFLRLKEKFSYIR